MDFHCAWAHRINDIHFVCMLDIWYVRIAYAVTSPSLRRAAATATTKQRHVSIVLRQNGMGKKNKIISNDNNILTCYHFWTLLLLLFLPIRLIAADQSSQSCQGGKPLTPDLVPRAILSVCCSEATFARKPGACNGILNKNREWYVIYIATEQYRQMSRAPATKHLEYIFYAEYKFFWCVR